MMVWVGFPLIINDDNTKTEEINPLTAKQAIGLIVGLLSSVALFAGLMAWMCA